jgi:glycolate oxidase subunit GlcD
VLVKELSRLIGAGHVLDGADASPYNSDLARRRDLRGRADAVALPGSPDEVAQVLAWCYEHDVPLIPRGGGTGLTGGAVPVRGGVVCSMERLRAVRELDPGLWRILPEAGVSTRDVQRLARENGLMFAPDPGASEQSQIGGNVATNAGGPHTLKYGVTGAWVAGVEAVLAPGELVEIGGWAGKDVAGYDLKSLLIGSEGTLGVITAVRLRLLPRPECALAMVLFLRSLEEGCDAVTSVFAAGVMPSALDFVDGQTLELAAASFPGEVPPDARFALIAEIDGTPEQARSGREDLLASMGGSPLAVAEPQDAEALWRWRDGLNGVVTGTLGGKVAEDVVFPVEHLAEGLRRFHRIAEEHGLRSCAWGHAGDGNVHANVMVDPASEPDMIAAEAVGERLMDEVVALGGSISGEHGLGWVKAGRLASHWPARTLELHEQIKRAFDPKGLLNPGKKLAR